MLLILVSGIFGGNDPFHRSLIEFSSDIFRKLSSQNEQNTFISPVSIYLALAMAYNGARGNTQKAMAECLKANHISINELNRFGKEFMAYIKSLENDVTINIANSLWIKSSFPVRQNFIQRNKDFFHAEINRIAMIPSDVTRINRWIESKTHNRIQNMLSSLDSNSRMLLINAIYFLGNWEQKFLVADTLIRHFYLTNGKKIETKLMNRSGEFPYYETADYQAVCLDYKNQKLGLVVVLPQKGKKLSQEIAKLNIRQYYQIINGLSVQAGMVMLPKFKFRYSRNLIPVLKKMGMSDAFRVHANFSGIHPRTGLFLNMVQHDAFIEVNETGTEAAAATVVGIAESSASARTRPFVFRAERPFYYFIIDKQRKVPFFMGTLYKP